MPTLIDLAGRRFGRLVVSARDGSRNGIACWLCICDCGTQRSVHSQSLRSGNTTSCGCRKAEVAARRNVHKRLPDGVARCRQVIRRYQLGAAKRGLEWALSDEQAQRLMRGNCHYCGVAPGNISRAPNGYWGLFVYNGIDRQSNVRGYTPSNSVSCCRQCNRAKGAMAIGDFMRWLNSVHAHLSRGRL